MSAKIVWVTPNAEELIAYIARVSSEDQDNPNYARLLRYCIDHKHWSPFEHATMCVEIETSRAISAQIIRHRSFRFQEFSQRYAKVQENIIYGARRQDKKNRQNSIDDLSEDVKAWWVDAQQQLFASAKAVYDTALQQGIAKECARFILPLSTKTRLYMTGEVRNWIHYLELRDHQDAQLEHRVIAQEIKPLFIQQFPIVSAALGWKSLED